VKYPFVLGSRGCETGLSP